MSREIVVEETVIAAFERAGWYQRKVIFVGVKGCPDRWFVRKGMWVIIEFKKVDGQLSGHQIRRIKELRDHGQDVHVIYSIEHGLQLLEHVTIESDRRAAC